MTEFTTLRINRSQPDAGSSGDWLRIEQPEWPEAPAGGFFAWMSQQGKGYSLVTLHEYFAIYASHCEGDGSLTVEIQVHRSRPDLAYKAHASYGELSAKYIHQGTHKKSVTVEQADSLDLEVQLVGTVSAFWESVVFDASGSEVFPHPPISVNGSVLSWGGMKVSGVLRLAYTEEHDAYTLTIAPRPAGEYEANDRDGAYQSTVFAVWAGGVESHDVDLPDMSGSCAFGESLIINPDDPDDPDDEQCVRHNILVDACTKEIIREWDEAIPCPENDEDEQ
jgi:hypothetical protein